MIQSTGKKYSAIVIGVSAGGLAALDRILPKLNSDFSIPILVVQHISADSENYLPQHFSVRCAQEVKEAEDKEPIAQGTIYIAPPNYHLMVECDRTVALSIDPKVNFSRPSIDVLFETAADAYCDELVGLVLTGGNSDGAKGLAKIKKLGGLTVVQSPETAEVDAMPLAALEAVEPDHVVPLKDIANFLNDINDEGL
ncbi:chemotaxis protein CheB [Pseudodesulfovibrio sp. zrk46]|uniref:chemotaxis protein CheB n=1 Tax=Pseudodesulfovibrio sp. zrk46 TaxID=2725288 RepID=UPI001449509E|nr:chemotaxis protein CheB [Pseudodesulfovibrio sp. zrk46]QJB57089.1 chemotaxis protein CheB [Pseudodesulfovibrio sp. zrk46]